MRSSSAIQSFARASFPAGEEPGPSSPSANLAPAAAAASMVGRAAGAPLSLPRRVFDLIAAAAKEGQSAPSLRRMADRLGSSSPTVGMAILRLERAGQIRRLGEDPRDRYYEVVATGEKTIPEPRARGVGGMSQRAQRVLDFIRAAIGRGEETPKLDAIAKIAGGSRSRGSACQAIDALVARGHVRRDGAGDSLVYVDCATGNSTKPRGYRGVPKDKTAPAPEALPARKARRVSEHSDHYPAAARASRANQARLERSKSERNPSKARKPAPIQRPPAPRPAPLRAARKPARPIQVPGHVETVAEFLARKGRITSCPTAHAAPSEHYRTPSREEAAALARYHEARDAAEMATHFSRAKRGGLASARSAGR